MSVSADDELLYSVLACIPVAAAMDLILEPGRLMVVRSSCYIAAKGMYSRIVLTSTA